MSSTRNVQLQVGNTYRRVPEHSASLDKSGRYPKTHDWTLFVDVIAGNVDLIERVIFNLGPSFSPSEFACSCPVPAKSSDDGGPVLRFSTRQQTYGSVTATITIRGVSGTTKRIHHSVCLDEGGQMSAREIFTEARPLRPLRMLKLPDEPKYGIELELTSAVGLNPDTIASSCENRRTGPIFVADSYSQGRATANGWKIVPDSSIVCSASLPDCNKFELVSPPLLGGDGLNCVQNVLQGLSVYTSNKDVKVNKSMGFHVHVDVSKLSLQQLIRVCQNFIKYEDAMDSLMPPSRRTGSPESNQYFQSNRTSVGSASSTNKERHLALANCTNLVSLSSLMNRGNSRYYKLNLQNLVSGRQPTLEFRQHSATATYTKVAAWIRFCVAFCVNSARLKAPTPFKESINRSTDDQLSALFYFVIKDRALSEFYRARRDQVNDDGDSNAEHEYCCGGCASGHQCQTKRLKSY